MERLPVMFYLFFLASLQWRGSMAQWIPAVATFYGGADGSGTMGGACGYGNLYNDGYGYLTAAVSTVLFNNGGMCGACYQIKCDPKSQWCIPSYQIVTITATNFCPPNYALPSDNGGWCNPPRQHFEMSQPAFETIALYSAGVIPIYYQRVRCQRSGGVKFQVFNANPYFELVKICNVGGSGVISAVWIKGSKTDWMPMSRNWGQIWQSSVNLNGQSLSFMVQTDNGKTVTFYDVAPYYWSYGGTYTANGLNF